jgi:hypothetical protein
MLHRMQAPNTSKPAQAYEDFAGLMASFATAGTSELPAWRDDELTNDVTTLSYEQALRNHARYKETDTFAGNALAAAMEQRNEAIKESSGTSVPSEPPLTRPDQYVTGERDRKCASVTIRMSKAECEQLHQRAAEAGMTISAYLRSCTFEAESLRAQVKEALSELRKVHTQQATNVQGECMRPAAAKINSSANGSRLGWLRRLVPDLNSGRTPARA